MTKQAKMMREAIERNIRLTGEVVVDFRTLDAVFPKPLRLNLEQINSEIDNALHGKAPSELGESQEQQIKKWCSQNGFVFQRSEELEKARFFIAQEKHPQLCAAERLLDCEMRLQVQSVH